MLQNNQQKDKPTKNNKQTKKGIQMKKDMGEMRVNFPDTMQKDFSSTDMYNKEFDQNSEMQVIEMADESHQLKYKSRPFDWFICSVLGYLLCPCIGICALYYAIRANYASDWKKDEVLINRNTRRAKCLTLTSIGIGIVYVITLVVVFIIVFIQIEKLMPAVAIASLQQHQQTYNG